MQNTNILHDNSSVKAILVEFETEGENCFRTVSSRVLVGQLEIPAEQQMASKDWTAALAKMPYRPQEISTIPASTIATSPINGQLLNAAFELIQEFGLPDLREHSVSVSALGCYTVPFHHDAHAFSEHVFGVVWTAPSAGLELVFPNLNLRIPLSPGSVVLFDACPPHGVLREGQKILALEWPNDVPPQTFISFDFCVEIPRVSEVFGIQLRPATDGWGGVILKFSAAGAQPTLSPKVHPRTGRWRKVMGPRKPRPPLRALWD